MRNMDINSSVERMKQLMSHGSQDAALKANVSETVEYKVNAPDGKTYGVVRERQKYFIKESKDGVSFDYLGGIGNKSENEYPSYNSAYRNLELKIREMNTSKNTGNVFETFKPVAQAEYIIEATEDMRKELDRFKQITNGAQNIMNESSTEFINKPKFKDPEGFGTATDPKKQGQPFTDAATAKLDKDPNFKATDPKKQGEPFTDKAKSKEDKFDIEKTNDSPAKAGEPFTTDAKDVLGNSVATQKPKGGKVIKVTESQLAQVRKYLSEGMFDDDFDNDLYVPDDMGGNDDFDDEKYDMPDLDGDDFDSEPALDFPIPSRVKYVGSLYPKLIGKTFDYVGRTPAGGAYISYTNPNTGKEIELDPRDYKIEISDLERVGLHEGIDETDEMIDEGLWDTIKGVGSVGKYFGGKAAQGVKQGAQNAAGAAAGAYNKAAGAVSGAYNKAAGAVKQGAQNLANDGSRIYNQSQAQSSQAAVDKIANNLKAELINLNQRTIKAGGQPLNYNSVLTSLSNKLRGQLKTPVAPVATESIDNIDDNLVNEITEAVLNAFGQHPTYQKPAFTTPPADGSLKPGTHEWDDASVKGQSPYGQKIGDSAPFTNPVKQKVGVGEIGEDADETMKGKTQQGLPSLGKKGDKAPFDKSVQKNGDKIAKGTPVQQGEKPQGKAELGKKGDKAPFDKAPTKKAEVLNKLAESIIADLKKK